MTHSEWEIEWALKLMGYWRDIRQMSTPPAPEAAAEIMLNAFAECLAAVREATLLQVDTRASRTELTASQARKAAGALVSAMLEGDGIV